MMIGGGGGGGGGGGIIAGATEQHLCWIHIGVHFF